MAKIINFPCFLENQIRLNNSIDWRPAKDYKNYNAMFTAGKSYALVFDGKIKEWYVQDDMGQKNFLFYLIEGIF